MRHNPANWYRSMHSWRVALPAHDLTEHQIVGLHKGNVRDKCLLPTLISGPAGHILLMFLLSREISNCFGRLILPSVLQKILVILVITFIKFGTTGRDMGKAVGAHRVPTSCHIGQLSEQIEVNQGFWLRSNYWL